MFREKLCNGHRASYLSPRVTVHITSGSAGNRWKLSPVTRVNPHLTAFGLQRHWISVISRVTTHSMTTDYILAYGQYGDSVKIVNENRSGK